MKIAVAVPVMNQPQVTQEFLDNLKKTSVDNTPLIIVDNGSKPPVRDWLIGLSGDDFVIRNEENVGVLKALNQAWRFGRELYDYIFYTHNDVMIYEQAWDRKIVEALEAEERRKKILGHLPEVGIAGFFGSKSIGRSDIYHAPYAMHQMVRGENVSNCKRMDPVHNYRPINGVSEDVAVLDGFSLIVNVKLLDQIGGFDEKSYPLHHCYDNDLCLESLDKGFRNIVIPMDAQHLGGRTDVGENWAEPFGKTKQQVHEEAHVPFYNKWHPNNVADGTHKISMPIVIR